MAASANPNPNKWEDEDLPLLPKRLLFALNPVLDVNPVLAGTYTAGIFNFNLVTGISQLFDPRTQEELPVEMVKDQPATAPLVTELVILCDRSPWSTTVRDEDGVTVDDVLAALFEDYDQPLIPEEVEALHPRTQDQLARVRRGNEEQNMQVGVFHQMPPGEYKRVDYLRNHIFLRQIDKDDNYIRTRLQYVAPHVFILRLTS